MGKVLIDIMDPDADNDGLRDGLEDLDHDGVDDGIGLETNPYNPDSDGDGLIDGAEPSPYTDIDNDGKINARDGNSNDLNNNPLNDDYPSTFVTFRTTAKDANGDGVLDYGSGTKVACPLNDFTLGGAGHDLDSFSFDSFVSSPQGNEIKDTRGTESVDVMTPDHLEVRIYNTGTTYELYIDVPDSLFPGHYAKYVRDSTQDNSIIGISVVKPTGGKLPTSNEVTEHQITIDWRQAISTDNDMDGLSNNKDPNNYDIDSDDDGVIDGLDPDPSHPDTDGDGLPDGLEMGIVKPLDSFYIGTTEIGGTDTAATFNIEVYNAAGDAHKTVPIKSFIADSDPTTKTNPENADSDGDGITDGHEDSNIPYMFDNFDPQDPGAVVDYTKYFNGKFDGAERETNPLDMDTDDDGLVDGWIDLDKDTVADLKEGEDLDCNGWIEAGSETDPTNHDTDGDGLSDGTERGLIMGEIFKDTDMSVGNFVPDADPDTTTDPLEIDNDGDGIPDGWVDGFHGLARDGTFQFGEGEDKNFNGKVDPTETNPNAVDSDSDGLLDGWDILTSSAHSGWDSIVETDDGPSPTTHRYWGELSYGTNHNLAYLVVGAPTDVFLQQGPTDPTSVDSDGDGLIDGKDAMINGESRTGELTLHAVTRQNIWTDPSKMDTDGDGLSDGMEFNGWEVNIIMEKTKERVETRQVHSDPAYIANVPSQGWSFTSQDGDGDGVTDYEEFVNSSNPNNIDTDGDRILDGNEAQGELTQIEGKDPEILKFKFGAFGEYQVFSKVRWTWGETVEGVKGYVGFVMVVYVKAGDNAGLDYISIKIPGKERAFKYFDNAPLTYTTDDNDFVFKIDWSKTLLSGYDVNITVADVNGNGNYTNTHIDGLVEGVIKALVNAFHAFVDAVKELVSGVLEWIYDLMNKAIDRILKPAYDLLMACLNSILDGFYNFVETLNSSLGRQNSPGTPPWLEAFSQWISSINWLIVLFIIIFLVMIALEILLYASTMGMGYFLKEALLICIGIGIFYLWGACSVEQKAAVESPTEDEKQQHLTESKVSGVFCDLLTFGLELIFVSMVWNKEGGKLKKYIASVLIFILMGLLMAEVIFFDSQFIEDNLFAWDLAIGILLMLAGSAYLSVEGKPKSTFDWIVLIMVVLDFVFFLIQIWAHRPYY